LLASLESSTQDIVPFEVQAICGYEQPRTQCPDSHVSIAPHEFPHAPQF
jgi:hypothetical protein